VKISHFIIFPCFTDNKDTCSDQINWDEKFKHCRFYIIWTEFFFSRIRQRETFDKKSRSAVSSSRVLELRGRVYNRPHTTCYSVRIYMYVYIYGVYGLFDESESLFAWRENFPRSIFWRKLRIHQKNIWFFNTLNKSLF